MSSGSGAMLGGIGGHVPVLLREVVRLLDPRPGETLLDCTAGLGGHAAALAQRLGPSGVLVLNDVDPGCLARAAALVRSIPGSPRVIEQRGNYADAPRKLSEKGLAAGVVLADLGFASSQMEDAARGLSFMRDGPLDMRLDPSGPVTAAELVNSLGEAELGEIIRDFGEEKRWRRVAQKLVAERKAAPIDTTMRLASLVRSVVGERGGRSRIDPATRTFQALRIAVNDELGSLRSLLEAVARVASGGVFGGGGSGGPMRAWMARGARVGIISFHSLEDRLVKQAFADLIKRGLAEALTRRPVEGSPQEQGENPRSRSAKLRVVRLMT